MVVAFLVGAFVVGALMVGALVVVAFMVGALVVAMFLDGYSRGSNISVWGHRGGDISGGEHS